MEHVGPTEDRERWVKLAEIVTRRRPDLSDSSGSRLEPPLSPDLSDEIQLVLIDELLEFGFVPSGDEANPYGMTVEGLIDFVIRNTAGSDLD